MGICIPHSPHLRLHRPPSQSPRLRVAHRMLTFPVGTLWRHLAWQYPASAKPMLDAQIARTSRALDDIAEQGCAENLFSQ